MTNYEIKQLMNRASNEIERALVRESSKAAYPSHGCVHGVRR